MAEEFQEPGAEQEPQIKTIEEYHERTPRRWPLLAAYIAAAIIIALILVFGIRAIYHHYHHLKKTPAVGITSKWPDEQPSGSSSTGSGSSPSSSSSPAAGSSSPSTNSNLPNSGPGSVVGIFAASSLVAAGSHYLIKQRRYSKNR